MKKGFTLIELIIVVIIIGILATIAVPQYMTATERAKGGKAKNALALIAQGEKLYRGENDTYVSYASKAAINTGLAAYIELDQVATDTDWDYDTVGTATTLTATASRVAGGKNAGEKITLTQTGVWGGNFTP